MKHLERRWADTPATAEVIFAPRSGIITEHETAPGHFRQAVGPFQRYERHCVRDGNQIVERTDYDLRIPWFSWLFAIPVRRQLARRGRAEPSRGMAPNPWWAPPDQLDERQVTVLALIVTAAMAAAFINTLFTQTATFAADSFGVGDAGVGWSGAIVRLGVIVSLPFAFASDRVGRRRVIMVLAWAAPIVSALGAVAPSFWALVATQAVGRPLGLALDLLVAVVAAEEMPKSSRAYAVSLLAMASGLGAGIAVWVLPLADLGSQGWRWVYAVALIWLVPAVSLSRSLPESVRFERPHATSPPIDRRRLALVIVVVVFANVFVAPASFFQNRYLSDIRGMSATMVAVFTVTTATPAGLGLVVGGKLADVRGRRILIAMSLPIATALITASFWVDSVAMWVTAFGGGFVGGIAYPALAVYRAELFPTGNRGRAAGLQTAAALAAGGLSIIVVGQLVGAGAAYGPVLTVAGLGQLAVVAFVVTSYPESAHRELEDLNEIDRVVDDDLRRG